MRVEVYKNINEIPINILEIIKNFDIEGISDYFSDPFTFNVGIVLSDDDKVIGAGVVRVINEFKITMNPAFSNISIVKGINKLFQEAIKNMQCRDAIVDITQGGDHYINILKDHFNFKNPYGKVLRLER